MSVLKKFFEMAILLTFMLFCINGMMFYFGDTMVPDSAIPISELTGDQNIFVESDTTSDYLEQSATAGSPPTDFGYIQNAIVQLAFGFEIKLAAILAPYEGLHAVGLFIGLILNIIKVSAIIYLIFAAIGTPLGGSVP